VPGASPEPWSGVPSSSVEFEELELRLLSVQGAVLFAAQLFELAWAGDDVSVAIAAREIASVETPARRREECFMCFGNSSM
jgi:hypothetical protein